MFGSVSDSVLAKISLSCWVVWLTLVSALGAHNQDWLLHYATKPFIMGSLLIYVAFTAPPGVPQRGWLLGAMAMAMLGDLLLMIQDTDLFIPGMMAFIGMQVCYGMVFWRGIRASARRPTPAHYVVVGGPVAAYIGGFVYYLSGILAKNPALQILWGPIAAYAVVLGILCVLGVLWHVSVSGQGFPWVAIGAFLFMASTTLQAIIKFAVTDVVYFGYVVLVVYALSQVLMVIGYVSVYEPDDAPADLQPTYAPSGLTTSGAGLSSPISTHHEQLRLS